MSTGKLYEEAVAEAKDLVRMAEENAKNKLIDAFTPRIRRLVESKLLSEDDSDDVMDIVNAASDDEPSDDMESDDEATPPAVPVGEAEPDDFEFDDYDDDDFDVDDGIDLHVPQGVKRVTFDLEEKAQLNDRPVEMTSESVKTLLKIVDGRGNLRDRTKALRFEAKILRRALGALNGRKPNKQASDQIVEEFNAVLRKAIGLKQELRDASPGTLAEAAKTDFNNLLEEISDMSTRTLLRNLLAESNGRKGARRLFEADEEEADAEGGDDAEMDAGDEGGDEGDDEGDKEEVTLSPELVNMLRDALGGAAAEEPAEDMGDEMAEYDESSMYEADEAYEMDEADKDEADEKKHESYRRRSARGQTVYTIDESMLRRELLRLRRLREEADPMVGSFANAEDQGDAFEDPTELNLYVKESDAPKREKKMETQDKKDAKEAKREAEDAKESAEEAKNEARRFRRAAVQEARMNRELKARLSEAAKAVRALNGQLQEQKLFNAKLLYVNKLMQNRSLSDKQLRAVVEALDAAKTLRETKLLYTSLTESLTRGKPMTEGANRTVAGSSRPTGSGSTLNESVGEVDRWAILAGISK